MTSDRARESRKRALSGVRGPRLVRTWQIDEMSAVPQQHGFGPWNRDGETVLAPHLRTGLKFFDVASVGMELSLLIETTVAGTAGDGTTTKTGTARRAAVPTSVSLWASEPGSILNDASRPGA